MPHHLKAAVTNTEFMMRPSSEFYGHHRALRTTMAWEGTTMMWLIDVYLAAIAFFLTLAENAPFLNDRD